MLNLAEITVPAPSPSDETAEGLNPQQNEVANSNDKYAVVLAGAGTGKTKTAVSWVARKIRAGVRPSAIAMLTFTKKAAAEMLTRISQITGPQSGLFAGTFHSFAYRALRVNPHAFGFATNKISLLSPRDGLDVLEQELNNQDIQVTRRVRSEDLQIGDKADDEENEEGAPPPKKIRVLKNGKMSLQDIAAIISDALNRAASPGEALLQASGSSHLVDAYDGYVAFMLQHGMIDYDHLLTFFLAGLKSQPEMLEWLGSTYEYLLVDEVQDNNATQFEIVSLLPIPHKMLIGDIQQSIYRFRGAFPQGVLNFIDANPGCKEYRLERNYRSKQNILDIANHVVQTSDKALTLVAHRQGTGNIVESACYGPEHLADAMHRIVVDQAQASGEENVAILSWTLNSPALFFLEQSLKREGIQCRRVGGKGVLGAKEALDFCAFLRVAHNERDVLGMRRILLLMKGVGGKTANSLMREINACGAEPEKWRLADKARDTQMSLVRTSIALLRSKETSFEAGLKATLDSLRALYEQRYPEDWEEKLQKPKIIMNYCLAQGLTLEEAIEEFVLPKADPKDDGSPKVTISTIHSAKGLEWENVTLINMGDKEFGHSDTAEDELVRLMYVAITRAKNTLVMLRMGQKHRFLQEANV